MPAEQDLSAMRRPIDVAGLTRSVCAPNGPCGRFEWVDETGSTNDSLADAVALDPGSWPDFSVYGTEFQAAGHGRLGRGWQAPPGSALLLSVLLRPLHHGASLPAESLGWVPLLGGLAAARAIRDAAGVDAHVKWPNDVLTDDGRKLCGILARALTVGDELMIVLGSGINVSTSPKEIGVATATSLTEAGGHRIDRGSVLQSYLAALSELYLDFVAARGDAEASGLAAEVREATATLGTEIRVERPDGTSFTGQAVDIDARGQLVVSSGGERLVVAAGDVHHVRPHE